MSNMIWFLVGWVVMAILAWMLYAQVMARHLIRKANGDDMTRHHYASIVRQVDAESIKDGTFVEVMRLIIFPCGIAQRTMAIMKAIRKYQEEVQ